MADINAIRYSVNQNGMQQICEDIRASVQNINTTFLELKDINWQLHSNSQGILADSFERASRSIENGINTSENALMLTAKEIRKHSSNYRQINAGAGYAAGGMRK